MMPGRVYCLEVRRSGEADANHYYQVHLNDGAGDFFRCGYD
jgi:hypothetical protein